MTNEEYDDELEWALETIAEAWPDGDFDDVDAYRVNRNDPRILETGERTRSVDLTRANVIGATRNDRLTDVRGTEYDHDVETVLSLRIEGVHSSCGGHVESDTAFEQFVRRVAIALLTQRSYPDVEPEIEDVWRIDYQDLRIENEQDHSQENGDYFRRDLDVRLTGIEQLPEL